MKTLKPNEMKFWQGYLDSLPASARPILPYVEAAFPGNRKIADGLLDLYLTGEKTAGSSLVKDFEAAGDRLPAIGSYWIILDSKDTPACIVKTVNVACNLFKDIPELIAKAEGEGDCSVAYWKKAHGALFSPYLEKLGINDLQNAMILTEFFKVVYRPY